MNSEQLGKWLKDNEACLSAVKLWETSGKPDLNESLDILIKNERYSDLEFIIEKALNKDQSVELSIFCAEMCISNFEKEYPDDDRPRKAIEAAKAYLENPCEQTKDAAKSAARSARSAAWSAVRSAAWSARSAARSAWLAESAWSAAWSAESAARSAAWSAESAARSAAWSKIIIKLKSFLKE